MWSFDKDKLVAVLATKDGVDLVSLGKPRDGFALPVDVPHWTSGYGGQYEMIHTHVPKGAMVAAGDLESLDVADFESLKTKLSAIDIYPTGHSGDFTGKDIAETNRWFFDNSVVNEEANSQWPLRHTAHRLKAEHIDDRYGKGRYTELVDHLTDAMNLFKDPKNSNVLVPEDRAARREIVTGLLEGISEATRYTRKDSPALGYQFSAQVEVSDPNAGTLNYALRDVDKLIVLRKDAKTGETMVTPLDRAMIGKTYDTKDGEPLGDRGRVDLIDLISEIARNDAAADKKRPASIKDIVAAGPQTGRGDRSID